MWSGAGTDDGLVVGVERVPSAVDLKGVGDGPQAVAGADDVTVARGLSRATVARGVPPRRACPCRPSLAPRPPPHCRRGAGRRRTSPRSPAVRHWRRRRIRTRCPASRIGPRHRDEPLDAAPEPSEPSDEASDDFEEEGEGDEEDAPEVDSGAPAAPDESVEPDDPDDSGVLVVVGDSDDLVVSVSPEVPEPSDAPSPAASEPPPVVPESLPRPASRPQVGHAAMPWAACTFSAILICWERLAWLGAGGVVETAVLLPGILDSSPQAAVVPVAAVLAPGAAGLALGDLVPVRRVGRVGAGRAEQRDRDGGAGHSGGDDQERVPGGGGGDDRSRRACDDLSRDDGDHAADDARHHVDP
ncbi:hypothetical protein STENM327S_03932 [Streptomyces tendae]